MSATPRPPGPGNQLVSIVVPALDEAGTLPRCLRSLAGQDGPFEVIVADGGSRDATARIASDAGARVVAAPRGRGPQQNAGAAAARGELLWFLHADAVAPGGALHALRAALADPRVAIGAFRLAFDAAGPALRAVARGAAWRSRWLRLPYGDQGLFTTRRRHFEAAGGFEDVPLFEDVRLVRALRRRGRLALLAPAVTVSGRRYRRDGVAPTVLRHARLLLLERLGVPPSRLAALREAPGPRRAPGAEEALLLFARWPEPGRAKTRLAPRLGPERAAAAYRAVAASVAAAAAALGRRGLVRVACIEPAERAADAARWLGPAFEVAPQRGADLGARLVAAFDDAFARGAARVVAIGADAPGTTAPLLAQALDALRTHDAVIGPACDGGYWLIGFGRTVACGEARPYDAEARPYEARPGDGDGRGVERFFRDIPWSSAETLATTRARLAGLRVAELPVLRDLDTPDDLDALAREHAALLGPFLDNSTKGTP